jgi:hypothetical protein
MVLNTSIHRPRSRDPAQRLYRENLAAASDRHRSRVRGYYARVASTRSTRFRLERGNPADLAAVSGPERAPPRTPKDLSSRVAIVELPCVLDRFIKARPAVRHPSPNSPVAFPGDVEPVPLLRRVRAGMTVPEMLRFGMPWITPDQGLSIAHWLMARRLLVPHERGPMAYDRGLA